MLEVKASNFSNLNQIL